MEVKQQPQQQKKVLETNYNLAKADRSTSKHRNDEIIFCPTAAVLLQQMSAVNLQQHLSSLSFSNFPVSQWRQCQVCSVYYDKQKIKTMWRKICVKHIWFKYIRMFSISVCLNKEQLKCSASSPNFNDSFSLHLTCHIMLVFFVFFLDTSACCRISSLVFFTQPSFKSTLQPAASIFCPPSVWMLLSLIKPRSSLSAHTSFFLTEFCACLWFQFFPDSNSQPFVLI